MLINNTRSTSDSTHTSMKQKMVSAIPTAFGNGPPVLYKTIQDVRTLIRQSSLMTYIGKKQPYNTNPDIHGP